MEPTKNTERQIPPNEDWTNFEALKDYGLLAGGISLAMYGLSRRHPLTLIAGGIGAFVAAKKANSLLAKAENTNFAEALIRTDRFEEVARSVTIRDAAPDVFGYVRDLSNIPSFLPIVKLVNVINEKRAIWTVKRGPGSVVLDVEVASDTEDRVQLRFSNSGIQIGDCDIWILPATPNIDQTRVTMRLKYHPLLGGLVDKVMRSLMLAELDTYLFKLKQFAETGEIAKAK